MAPADRRAEDRARHTGRAVSAAAELAREHDVECDEPVVLNDLFSVMVHLPPGPVVARVSTYLPKLRPMISRWHQREIDVTTYLSRQGAPVVTPSGELPPGPHEYGGFTISFWTHLDADPDRRPTSADCSAMLVDLHACLRSYPGELPTFLADDMPGLMAAMARSEGILTTDEADRIRQAHERLRHLWELGDSLQPVHGDAHAGNLVPTRDGLIWIDFEDVALAPAEWDLAAMWDAEAVAAHHRPDPERLAQCSELRALQVALALIAFDDELGDIDGWGDGIRGMLGALGPAST